MLNTKSLQSSADNRNFLKTVVGWWMQDRAVHGKLECERLPIPEEAIAKVGRPRKKGKEKAE